MSLESHSTSKTPLVDTKTPLNSAMEQCQVPRESLPVGVTLAELYFHDSGKEPEAGLVPSILDPC